MTRRGTLYDPDTHELIARIEHGGIDTSQDADGGILHRAEFYVLEEIRAFLPLLKGGLVWARLAGGLEGLAFIVDAEAPPGRLIQARLKSTGRWEARPASATI
jgi:hypothetical protein